MSSSIKLRHRHWLAVLALLLAVCALSLVAPPTAQAITRDARNACGVTAEDVVAGTATVPANVQDAFFINVPADRDPAPVLCGNGVTTGAVHIEVKHNLSNWGEGVTAMVNTIDRGVPEVLTDRTVYRWTFRPGKTMVVVVGEFSVITAYPLDGLEETWTEASVAE